jgi:hypothetical protein
MQNEISHYISELNSKYKAGITTEHSFRTALEKMFKSLTNYTVINEARHIDCGAPDLTLLQNNVPIGYVEAKDIGKNLNSKEYKNQFDRYKKALDNLIITDYLTFQLFEGESLVTEIAIGKILPNKIEPIPDNFNAFAEMIRIFSLYNGKAIKDSNGIFAARLQDSTNLSFTRRNAAMLIPQANPFLRNLFQYIAGFDLDKNIQWIVDSFADMFNYVDVNVSGYGINYTNYKNKSVTSKFKAI